jgi:hypothetical protein
MKIVIKTLQGKQLPVEVEETYTVSDQFCGFNKSRAIKNGD